MPPAVPETITVAEALALPALRRGLPEVLAGASRLQRPIRWVHAGEVPNIAALLTGGELLLTTGMGLPGDEPGRRRFVAELAGRGVAALVVELGTALAEIPVAMREAAEAAALPLVALHREVAFVSVTEAIHTELVNRRYGLLQSGEALRDRLVAVLLAGDGLPELLRELSTLLGNPVFLLSPTGARLFHAGADDDLDALEQAGRQVGSSADVPFGPEGRPGRLVVLPTRRAATELDAIVLRHAAGIAALALLRAREEDELVARERGNLLAELADGTLGAVRAARQAEGLGFRPAAGELLAVAIEERTPSPESARAALLSDLRRELSGRAIPILTGARTAGGPLLGLLAPPADLDRVAAADHLARAAAEVWSRRRPEAGPVIALDGPVTWAGAGAALAAAAGTARAARRLPARPWFDGRETELERLLCGLGERPELAAFTRRNLGPLLDPETARTRGLRETLRVLCACGGHKAAAARELHLHRQALYHRIARIESLLGVDLSDPARLTTLDVALRAIPFLTGADPRG